MYKAVMFGSGLVALLVTIGYSVAVAMAASDGPGRLEVSSRIDRVALTIALGGGLLSVLAWLIQEGHRRNVRHTAQAVADAVAEQVVERIQSSMGEVAERHSVRAVSAVREVILGDTFAEVLDAGLQRARTYGMVHEARSRTPVTVLRRES